MSDTPMTAAELAGIEARIEAGTMTDEGGEEYIDAEPADIDALICQVKLQAEIIRERLGLRMDMLGGETNRKRQQKRLPPGVPTMPRR